MSSIAVITARGGSKRIPRKNIRDFCGKPIILNNLEVQDIDNESDWNIAEFKYKYLHKQ